MGSPASAGRDAALELARTDLDRRRAIVRALAATFAVLTAALAAIIGTQAADRATAIIAALATLGFAAAAALATREKHEQAQATALQAAEPGNPACRHGPARAIGLALCFAPLACASSEAERIGAASTPPSTEARPARPAGSANLAEPALSEPPAAISAQPRSPDAAPSTQPAAEAPFRVAVRFLCDEKYVAAEACDEVSWLAEVANDPAAGNLLDHDSGGPDGAIWNGNAPMVVIVPATVRSVSVGGTALAGGRIAGLRVYRVPPRTWNAALRPVPGKAYRAATVLVDGEVAGEIWYAEGE